MTTTTYYNLNIVEGTDIVNPLIVDNPNYAKIDEEMHNNAVAGVTLATEIANSTVHAITRENSDCSVIRFIATSRWKAGDTATVDGVPVTALLPNGETLPDGAYVINANVLCILTGTNLTVYLGGNKVENASDIIYNDTNVGSELDALNTSVEQINTRVEQINSNLTVRYNQETDMVQILVNGEWVDWAIGVTQEKYLIKNGFINGELVGTKFSLSTSISGNYCVVSPNNRAENTPNIARFNTKFKGYTKMYVTFAATTNANTEDYRIGYSANDLVTDKNAINTVSMDSSTVEQTKMLNISANEFYIYFSVWGNNSEVRQLKIKDLWLAK